MARILRMGGSREAGLGFFEMEYPGYGLAAGQGPSEKGIYAAAETALEYLYRELGMPRERTVLEGQSLGSGVAVEMAKRGHGARLVLITPYTSLVELGAKSFPWLPASLLVRGRFDSASKAPGLKLPVLINDILDRPAILQELVRFARGRA